MIQRVLFVYICNIVLGAMCITTSRTLNEILHYYETLDAEEVTHEIVRRSTAASNLHERHLNFKTHGKLFHLKLTTTNELFSPGFEVVIVHGNGKNDSLEIDKSSFYKGYLLEDYKSHAFAHVKDGMITGSVTSKDNTYVIEPMAPHVDKNKDLYKNKMIVYKVTDMKWNLTNSNSSKRINLPPPNCMVDSTKKLVVQDGHLKEIELNDDMASEVKNSTGHSRQKRNIVLTSKTMCNLVLVSDYLFFKHMGNDATLSVNYMLQVATFVNEIYRNTKWSDDIGMGIGFQVKKVIVHDEYSVGSKNSYNEKHYGGPWNVDRLLTEFSRTNWSGYCLAHLFTYQDFARGVIGLAYVASKEDYSVGGVCTEPFADQKGTRYLNCGLSSGQNWGRQLLTREAQLVTAHELGHNFGSSHDSKSCDTGGDNGKFIMYATSVAGDKSNNDKFSDCSKAAIASVLRAKRQKCFSDIQESFCGNQKVEEGEECDVGLNEDDKCCFQCKLKKDSKCSPLNKPCCTDGCQFASKDKECRPQFELECKGATKCDGVSAECPATAPKLQGREPCGLNKGNCISSSTEDNCISLCQQNNKTTCSCPAGGNACKVCCVENDGSCQPLQLQGYTTVVDNDGVPCQLESGPGYCNTGACEKIKSSVTSEFQDLLQDFTFSKFVRFMEKNIVGTIIVLSLFLWIPLACFVHHLDEEQDEKHEEMKHWQNPFSRDLIQKSSAVNKVKMLFNRGNQREQKLPRTQYHISS